MTGFQRLCIVTSVVLFGLIVLGGVVRATESGLGCPDWPTCHGSLIPKGDQATLIEFSHRLTASVASFLVLGVFIWSWRSFRRKPEIIWPATLVLILIVIQAGLGGVAVLNELPPEVITVHLGMALIILSLMFILVLAAGSQQRSLPRINVSPQFARLATAAAGTCLALMLIGAYVAGAGYGLACSGWPDCNGELVPSAEAESVQIHFLHRLVALILGICLVALAYVGWRERRRAPIAFTAAVAALSIYSLQAMIGAANIWTELADAASISHLAVATLLWSVLAVLLIRIYSLHEAASRVQLFTGRSRLAKVSQ